MVREPLHLPETYTLHPQHQHAFVDGDLSVVRDANGQALAVLETIHGEEVMFGLEEHIARVRRALRVM